MQAIQRGKLTRQSLRTSHTDLNEHVARAKAMQARGYATPRTGKIAARLDEYERNQKLENATQVQTLTDGFQVQLLEDEDVFADADTPAGAPAATDAAAKARPKSDNKLPPRVLKDLPLSCVLAECEGYAPGGLLLAAAEAGLEKLVASLLQLGVSVFEADPDANTALHFAAVADQHAICKQLIARTADPERVNMRRMSAWDVTLVLRNTPLRRIFRPSSSDLDFTEKAVNGSPLCPTPLLRCERPTSPTVTCNTRGSMASSPRYAHARARG